MKVRDFVEEDASVVIEVYCRSVHELNKEFYSEEQLAAWTSSMNVDKVLRGASQCDDYVVVELAGEMVGFGSRCNDELQALYVHPSFTRRGVGSALLEELLSRIEKDGFLCVRAESSLSTREFYEKHGFVAIKQSAIYLRNQDISIPCVVVQKLL